MIGRAEVERLKQKLKATFDRALIIQDSPELLSDLARYLCVLVAGFLEQAVQELILEYARNSASPSVQRYVESRIRNLTNLKVARLIDLFGRFDPDWRVDLEKYLVDERKSAIDSVIELRNTISHGRYAGVTMVRIRGYYEQVQGVVDHIADICDPQP